MVWLVTVLLIVTVWTFAAREAELRRQIETLRSDQMDDSAKVRELSVQLAAIEEQQSEAAERAGRERASIWRIALRVSALQHRTEALDADICKIEERIGETPERRAKAQGKVVKIKASEGASSL